MADSYNATGFCGQDTSTMSNLYSCLEKQVTLTEDEINAKQSIIGSTTTNIAQKRLANEQKIQLEQYKQMLDLKANHASQLLELSDAGITASPELKAKHNAALQKLFEAQEFTEDYDRLALEIAILEKEKRRLTELNDLDKVRQIQDDIDDLKQQQTDLGLTEQAINDKNNAFSTANQNVLDTYNSLIGLPSGGGGGGGGGGSFGVGDDTQPVTQVVINSRHCSVLPQEARTVLTNSCMAISNRLSFLNTNFAPPESALMLEGTVKINPNGTIQIPNGVTIPLPSGGSGGGGVPDGGTDPTGGSVWTPII